MVARQLIQIRGYHFSKSIKEQETMDEPRWSNCVGGGSGLCLAVKRPVPSAKEFEDDLVACELQWMFLGRRVPWPDLWFRKSLWCLCDARIARVQTAVSHCLISGVIWGGLRCRKWPWGPGRGNGCQKQWRGCLQQSLAPDEIYRIREMEKTGLDRCMDNCCHS